MANIDACPSELACFAAALTLQADYFAERFDDRDYVLIENDREISLSAFLQESVQHLTERIQTEARAPVPAPWARCTRCILENAELEIATGLIDS
jgi:hypothetical protein